MILGGGKLLKGLKQETRTHLLSGSLKRQSLVIFVELMLLPEGQSGYDSGIFSVVLFGPNIQRCGVMLTALSCV